MIGLLGAGLAAGLAGVTWLHLRQTSRGRAEIFPSLQLLEGTSPRRRPDRRIEEPIRWALRTAVLLAAAAALALARSSDPRTGLAILVDPASGPEGLALGRRILSESPASARAALLWFDGGDARAEARAAGSNRMEQLRMKLASCGAAETECLWRAAARDAGVLVLSPFGSGAWAAAVRANPRQFFYRRVPPAANITRPAEPAPPAESPNLSACRIVRSGESAESRIWEAALTSVTRRAETPPCSIRIEQAPGAGGGSVTAGSARLIIVSKPSAPANDFPRVIESRTGALRIADDLAPIAGKRAVFLDSSLALATDFRFASFLSPILSRRLGSEAPVLIAATSADDLARWTNDGSMAALARLTASEACRGESFPSESAPLPTALGWIDARSKHPSPVGLLDVAPGRYQRNDHRLVFNRERDPDATAGATSDSELAGLGGRNELPPMRASGRSIAILALLLCVMVLRIFDLPRPKAVVVALAYLASIAGVLLWTFDAPIPSRSHSGLTAVTSGKFSKAERSSLATTLAATGIELGSVPSDESAGSVAMAGREPSAPVDALVFPAALPRVDILSIELPDEVRVGESGELRLIVEARRAAGRTIRVRATADGGSGAASSIKVDGNPSIVALTLAVTPAAGGIELASVDARFTDSSDSDPDGAVIALVARPARRKFLVASTSPNWDARAAAEALTAAGIDVASLTALGKTAVVGTDAKPEDPSEAIARVGTLDHVDAVVLAGLEPLRSAARARLDAFVRNGGGLLLLGPVPGAPGVAVPVSAPSESAAETSEPVVGDWDREEKFEFEGFVPSEETLLSGTQVFGKLGSRGHHASRPWIAGRGFGSGRIVEVLEPDLWRIGGPGSSRTEAYATLIRRIVAWMLAGHRPTARIRLDEDLTSFVVDRKASVTRIDPASGNQFDGLSIDARDPLSAAPNGRARQRALALRRGRVLVEADSAGELAEIWKRLPRAEDSYRRIESRRDDRIAAGFLIVLLFEIYLRRRARVGRESRENSPPEAARA